jgi:DNA-binding NarL/FixJ family response regulator
MELRILLIDENPTFLAAVARFLGRIPGAKVVAQMSNLPSAHALLAELRPDLVLMDVTAARNGFTDFSQALQALPLRPKVVCLSIYDEPQYRLAGAELGNSFVSKSDLVVDLLPILEQLGLQVPHEWQPPTPADGTVDKST